MGWLWILVTLSALAILPLGVRGIYRKDGVLVHLLVGPIAILLYPRKKNKAAEKKLQQDKKPKEDNKIAEEKEGSRVGGKLSDFLPLVQVVLDFLGDFRRKLRVRRLEMLLNLAGGDPSDLALSYGKAQSILANLMPCLERLFVIGKRDLQIACDFTADETRLYVRVDATITLGRLLYLLVRYGYRGYKAYKMITNKNKAVQEK